MKARTGATGLSILVTLALTACGGSSGSSDNGQPPASTAVAQTTVGQITGFGSIFVNGIEYDTAGASYEVDDSIASADDALAVGMVVKVEGSVSADGRTGTARAVSYDDDIEGIVENLTTSSADAGIKTFSILGTTVQVDVNSTNFENEDDPDFSFDSIMNGDNVEVSGEYAGDVLLASYIEKQDALDDDFEAKGTIEQYNGSDQFVLLLRNDAALTVTLAAGAQIPSTGIADGQFVEVEGTIPDPVNAPESILATKVELEDHDRIDDADEGDIEIKGILNFDVDTETWSIKDVALSFSDVTEYSPESLAQSIADLSADGWYVEVEGDYVNDVLQVEEIELEEDELEFKGDVAEVAATEPRDGTITLSFGNATGSVDIRVTPDTMFRDDEPTDHYDLNSLMIGDKVEVEARLAEDGTIRASSLHLEDDGGYEIKGPVDGFDDVSISVLGVAFTVDENTFFENGVPMDGDYVELEDENGDGIADSVEIED